MWQIRHVYCEFHTDADGLTNYAIDSFSASVHAGLFCATIGFFDLLCESIPLFWFRSSVYLIV